MLDAAPGKSVNLIPCYCGLGSSPGQAIYEPFCGSGTTIIAGEMTRRLVHAIEIDPAYVDVAIKRWQDFTGNIALLEADGRGFEAVAAERQRGGKD